MSGCKILVGQPVCHSFIHPFIQLTFTESFLSAYWSPLAALKVWPQTSSISIIENRKLEMQILGPHPNSLGEALSILCFNEFLEAIMFVPQVKKPLPASTLTVVDGGQRSPHRKDHIDIRRVLWVQQGKARTWEAGVSHVRKFVFLEAYGEGNPWCI